MKQGKYKTHDIYTNYLGNYKIKIDQCSMTFNQIHNVLIMNSFLLVTRYN